MNLFVKAARILAPKGGKSVEVLRTQGAQLLKAIEAECERDKAMSNLKGKTKEIKAIIESA